MKTHHTTRSRRTCDNRATQGVSQDDLVATVASSAVPRFAIGAKGCVQLVCGVAYSGKIANEDGDTEVWALPRLHRRFTMDKLMVVVLAALLLCAHSAPLQVPIFDNCVLLLIFKRVVSNITPERTSELRTSEFAGAGARLRSLTSPHQLDMVCTK